MIPHEALLGLYHLCDLTRAMEDVKFPSGPIMVCAPSGRVPPHMPFCGPGASVSHGRHNLTGGGGVTCPSWSRVTILACVEGLSLGVEVIICAVIMQPD